MCVCVCVCGARNSSFLRAGLHVDRDNDALCRRQTGIHRENQTGAKRPQKSRKTRGYTYRESVVPAFSLSSLYLLVSFSLRLVHKKRPKHTNVALCIHRRLFPPLRARFSIPEQADPAWRLATTLGRVNRTVSSGFGSSPRLAVSLAVWSGRRFVWLKVGELVSPFSPNPVAPATGKTAKQREIRVPA